MFEGFVGKGECVGVAGHPSVLKVVNGTEQKLLVAGGGLDQRLRAICVLARLVHLKDVFHVKYQWYFSFD